MDYSKNTVHFKEKSDQDSITYLHQPIQPSIELLHTNMDTTTNPSR